MSCSKRQAGSPSARCKTAPCIAQAAQVLTDRSFVSTMRQEISEIVNLTSYYSPTWGASMLDSVRIWEAARATSAAPSFFDPCVIDAKCFVDGGTGANNPIHQLWAEASCVYCEDGASSTWKLEDHLHCLVSIGTGTPSRKPFGPELQDVATALRAIATSAESVAQTFEREHPHLVNNCVYFRFNVTNGLQGVGLEASDRLSEIEALTGSYCASATVTQKMKACACKLAGARSEEISGCEFQAIVRAGLPLTVSRGSTSCHPVHSAVGSPALLAVCQGRDPKDGSRRSLQLHSLSAS